MENLDIIESNSKNLLEIINQLLDISKIEAGKMSVSKSKIPLAMIIYEAEMLGAGLLSHKPEVEFIKEVEELNKIVYIDNSKVRQIINNLLGNAIKFTKKGYVKLKLSTDDNYLYISVTDTGIGIKEDEIDKIFKPFIQADPSITKEFGGTGLGLTITEKLVALLKGDIKVKSVVDQGTEFCVKILLNEQI